MVYGISPYLRKIVELDRYTIIKERSGLSNQFILGGTNKSRELLMKQEIDGILEQEQGIVYIITDSAALHRWEKYKDNKNVNVLLADDEHFDLEDAALQALFYDESRTIPVWLYIEEIETYFTHKNNDALDKVMCLGRKYYLTVTVCTDRLIGSMEKVIGKCKDPLLTDMESILANCAYLVILSRGVIRSKKLDMPWENAAFLSNRLSKACMKFINSEKHPAAGVLIDMYNQAGSTKNYKYKKFLLKHISTGRDKAGCDYQNQSYCFIDEMHLMFHRKN